MSNKRSTFSENHELRELLEENTSLNRTNCALKMGLVGLSIFSILSVNSCNKKVAALTQANSEVSGLMEESALSQKKVSDLSSENAQLKDYAEEAQEFARNIRPWYDENDSGCENTNCVACKKIEKENEQKFVAFTNAVHTLNINQKVLERLQKGYGK